MTFYHNSTAEIEVLIFDPVPGLLFKVDLEHNLSVFPGHLNRSPHLTYARFLERKGDMRSSRSNGRDLYANHMS